MRKARKYSAALGQWVEITEIYRDTFIARTEDGTLYTQKELDILKKGGKTPLQVHILKKAFNGTVEK